MDTAFFGNFNDSKDEQYATALLPMDIAFFGNFNVTRLFNL